MRSLTSVSHFGSSHSLFERAFDFSAPRAFLGFVLSKCLQPSFVVSHLFSWRVLTMDQTCQYLLNQSLLRCFSPNGSGPDLDHHSYDAHFKELRDMLVPLVRGVTDFENHVKTISDSVCLVTSRITNVEQVVSALSARMVAFTKMEHNFSALAARVCKIETNVNSASHVPMAKDHLTTTQGWLIPSQTQMMKMLEVPFYHSFRVNNAMLACLLGLKGSLQRLIYPHTAVEHVLYPLVFFFLNKIQMSGHCGTIQ